MNVYYVYAYLDPRKPGKYEYDDYKFDHEPFYIGKGTKSRILRHLKNENRNPIKLNKIKSIRTSGHDPILLKIIDNISNEESLKIEKELIKLIGRLCKNEGPLTNYSPGGETYIGYKHQEDYLEKLYKPVVKYDLDGNYIEEYKSVGEAGERNNIQPQTISQICSGRIKLHKSNFIFLYKGDAFEKRKRDKKEYPVIRIDYNNNMKEYKSVTDAAIDNKTTLSRINSVCMGDRFHTGGFLYRYKNHTNINEYTKKIEDNFGEYLKLLNKKINIDGIIYKNLLHVLKEKKIRITNLMKYINNTDNKIYKYYEFKTN